MPTVKFDLRDLIRCPLRACPACKKDGSYGVLSVHSYQYVRRCRDCWHTQTIPLPPTPRRKVIYLDQFVVSELMKARRDSKREEGPDPDSFWVQLDRQLTRLVLLQLAAFPDSAFHDEETTLARESRAIHRVYAGLSGDIGFRHYRLIQQRQLFEAVEAWAAGLAAPEYEIEGAIRGKLDAWQDVLSVSVPPSDFLASDLRADKKEIEEKLLPVLDKLAVEGRSFTEVFENDWRSWGPTVVRQAIADLQKQMAIVSGRLAGTLEDLLPSAARGLVMAVERGLKTAGVAEDEQGTKVLEFFLGNAPASVPFVRIRSLFYAALVRKMASGQRRPSSSIANDFEMIATYLPYCDAMFLDRQCHGLAGENPVREELAQHNTLLFSMSNREEFHAYLQHVAASAPPEHLERVREVIRANL